MLKYLKFPSYTSGLEQLSSAPCLALLVQGGGGGGVVSSFREQVAGPLDPKLAKVLRPQSLRALFGEDLVKNGVHCSDLEEDGPAECEYLFNTLLHL
jgi:nucleoside-diphosphate kinase